ncbi:MAG: helix-turn-helix domain-containing protein [Clostridia bacterium]|nr:helix-turn-helix domain-containing protein [Clostridia bacterium]
MIYGNLNDLIDSIEYGTKLHIGVLFLGNYGNEMLSLPRRKQIHACPICDEMKSRRGGFRRCFYCRNAAIKKAMETKEPFSGLCINGVYEYTHPVIINGEVASIIYIGNILPEKERSEKLIRKLDKSAGLIDTAEKDFSEMRCKTVSYVIEGYIRMSLELFPSRMVSKSFDRLIDNIKNYIEANIEFDIDLTLLSRIFHYSEKYLGRLFKKNVGVSFSEYLSSRRVEIARDLLLSCDDTVINISSRVGFNNVTYFNKIFKKYYGCSPSTYRKMKTLT